jgi:Domain of unknown function (DUF4832)
MKRMSLTAWIVLASITLITWQAAAGETVRRTLEYAPAPVDNPLKGLVPYVGDVRDRFPHSMEFSYLPLSALVTGYNQYDWKPLENLLDAVAARGHQTVFRVYLEYPGKTNVIPAFLINDGLKIHKYVNTNTQPIPPEKIETPDYGNAKLRKVMKQFIAALGKKYDGDPRIGFITAGLLGKWGEWHDYPRDELFASKEVQAEVMDAYEAAFKTTQILVRYPAGEQQERRAPNTQRRLGYHDDSFAWSTLATSNKGESWFFMAAMKAAGPAAIDKWKTHPIGGEIRPEAWGKVFDLDSGNKKIQDFRMCVEATHVSWLMDSGMFVKQNAELIKRAKEEVRRMGYEFHVSAVTITHVSNRTLEVKVAVENRGVAPYYYDWPVEFGLLGTDGSVVKIFKSTVKLTGLLPGVKPRVWDEKLALQGVKAGAYKLALRVPNPLPQGLAVRFANKTQDQHAFGWLTLMPIAWR